MPQNRKMFRMFPIACLAGAPSGRRRWLVHQCQAISPYPVATVASTSTVATIQNVSCPMQWVRRMYAPLPANQSNSPLIEFMRSAPEDVCARTNRTNNPSPRFDGNEVKIQNGNPAAPRPHFTPPQITVTASTGLVFLARWQPLADVDREHPGRPRGLEAQ